MWIDAVRYYLALVLLMGLASGSMMWLAIHPLAKSLRRVGLRWAYVVVAIPIILSGGAVLWFRDAILTGDYGTNHVLMALAVIPSALAMAIYVRHRKYLTVRIQVGVPELTGSQAAGLLTEGIYSRIRHPRYVETILWVLGYALLTNYLAVYVAFWLMLPILHGIVLLEEKELKERFGVAYDQYCRRVPRYVPRVTWGRQKVA